MVAIPLYRGNLHQAPDLSRRWLMPTRKISPKEFKTLVQRRSRVLSRLQTTNDITPYPNLDQFGTEQHQPAEYVEDTDNVESALKVDVEKLLGELASCDDDENGKKESINVDEFFAVASGELVALDVDEAKADVPENNWNAAVEEQIQATSEHTLVPPKDDDTSSEEKKKREVEEKLRILNERKHKLVQSLKQILHAEEELKRQRKSMSGIHVSQSGCPK